MINAQSIAKMKDGVILINNSRGALIDEQALADALNSGKIYAAGLDAVRNEPISEDNPLLTAKNCFITPHISWTAVEGRQRLASQAIGNVKAFLEGNPKNIVNEG
jgi:glycerate dehydrogenase